MIAFYLTFIAALITGLGARDQTTLARLTLVQGPRPTALAIAGTSAIVTAGIAAYAAWLITPTMPPRVRIVLTAIALILAGVELLFVNPGKKPAEPTRSLFALAVVIAMQQATDAARFLIFAIAVGTNAPVAAALGGAIGGLALMVTGWLRPAIPLHRAVPLARRIFGIALVSLGAVLWLRAIEFL